MIDDVDIDWFFEFIYSGIETISRPQSSQNYPPKNSFRRLTIVNVSSNPELADEESSPFDLPTPSGTLLQRCSRLCAEQDSVT